MSVVEVDKKGSELEASVGDEVIVRLTENSTTGYQWAVRDAGPALAVESSEVAGVPGAAPGAAGERVIRFRAKQPGTAVVSLVLERPWEHAQSPQDVFGFVVHVRKPT
jgi:predicted secreted protein